MTAAALTCPQCGAAAAPDAHQCDWCRAPLATVGCGACFGRVFVGSRHCVHCGARAREPRALDGTPWRCPSGHGELRGVGLGGAEVGECPECAGVWLDEETFQRVVAERARVAVVPQGGALAARPRATTADPVRYRPCPDCGKVMNRVNFARTSGVVIDACLGHGVWCDADELRRIVEFVQAGGMDISARREREQLALERRRLEFVRSLDTATGGGRDAAGSRRLLHAASPIGLPPRAPRSPGEQVVGTVLGAGLGLLVALLKD